MLLTRSGQFALSFSLLALPVLLNHLEKLLPLKIREDFFVSFDEVPVSKWEKVCSFLLGDVFEVLAVVSPLLLELLVSRNEILLFLSSSRFEVLLFIVHLLAPFFGLLLVGLVFL